MLASSALSSHSAAAVMKSAMSENHRKFLTPRWRVQTGRMTTQSAV
jgi:hypothetical protein